MNEIIWHNRARKQIKKIPENFREAIFDQVDKLAEPGWSSLDIKELKNHRYQFRLRVGRYRVFFDHDSEVRIVEIQEVKKRDERTY